MGNNGILVVDDYRLGWVLARTIREVVHVSAGMRRAKDEALVAVVAISAVFLIVVIGRLLFLPR
ncbi:MAG: hypothetical protein K6T65_13455 [Peptococcaceae bacterium]|nr:hypothetical protein [Peptococcaceae bacterium]